MATFDTNIFSTRRIEALTDGVFAIAMTLLVLDLKVSELGHVTTSAQLFNVLVESSSSWLSFVISFLLLGSIWAVHMRQFEHIPRSDRHLTTINTFRLLAVVLIPFTTSLSGAYPDIMLARIALPLNFLIIEAIGYWQWRYALKSTNNLADTIPPQAKHDLDVRNVSIISCAIVVTILAAFVGQIVFVLFALLPFVTKLIQRQIRVR